MLKIGLMKRFGELHLRKKTQMMKINQSQRKAANLKKFKKKITLVKKHLTSSLKSILKKSEINQYNIFTKFLR